MYLNMLFDTGQFSLLPQQPQDILLPSKLNKNDRKITFSIIPPKLSLNS